MLASQREVTGLQQQQALAELAEKEMGYILNDLGSIATQAALIAGFVYSSIAGDDNLRGRNKHNIFQDTMLVGSVAVCIVLNLITVTSSTFVTMSGPYRALTGNEEVLWGTLRALRRERARSIKMYWYGLGSFFLSLACSVYFGPWNRMSRYVMIFVTFLGGIATAKNKRRIDTDFGGVEGEVVVSTSALHTPPERRNTVVFIGNPNQDCPRCGAGLVAGEPYCARCGCHVLKTCDKCGTGMPAAASFCSRCGSSSSKAPPPALEEEEGSGTRGPLGS
ncbi:hypothetical protein CTAYLR_008774 [Chrysophaeum taylorii]|uniref:DZANK-type domain-containing protein n=1 Tax=Chrysophaeum taylorii TaxID=2483200 RepID=A0AAD7UCR0_9STRA|nr:hypothetical protein CTAYLR_008774 [Chrysophaeum taylorii]